MQFNKAPISRVISTKPIDESTVASPPVYSAGGVLGAGGVTLASGRAITLYFTKIQANQINIKVNEINTPTGLHVAPNVQLADADSYLFIFGNSVFPNTNNNQIHVTYSATIDNVKRINRDGPDSALVRPGDDLNIFIPDGYSSNILNVQGVTAKIVSVRRQNQNTFLVDFSVGINAALLSNTGLSGWAKNDLFIYTGNAAAPENLKGLGKDQLSLGVGSSKDGNKIWEGRLRGAINSSYPKANSPSIINPFDSNDTTSASRVLIASSGIPYRANKDIAVLDIYSDIDYNSGQMPFKCLSLVDNTPAASATSFYNLEISIIPLY